MLRIILKVGQQSLAVFVMSMFTARIMGFAMDVLGRETGTVLLVNLAGGGAVLIADGLWRGLVQIHTLGARVLCDVAP